MCLTTFLCSCKDEEDEILKKAERIKYERRINPIKNKETITLNDGCFETGEITIFEFQGCEYIMYKKYKDTRYGVLGLTHKGNCKYCSKNIKNN